MHVLLYKCSVLLDENCMNQALKRCLNKTVLKKNLQRLQLLVKPHRKQFWLSGCCGLYWVINLVQQESGC